MGNKEFWKYVIQLVVAILTAVGTTLGVTSCMGASSLNLTAWL